MAMSALPSPVITLTHTMLSIATTCVSTRHHTQHAGLWFSFHGKVFRGANLATPSCKGPPSLFKNASQFCPNLKNPLGHTLRLLRPDWPWFKLKKKDFEFWDNLLWRWDACDLNISAAPFNPQDSWSQPIAWYCLATQCIVWTSNPLDGSTQESQQFCFIPPSGQLKPNSNPFAGRHQNQSIMLHVRACYSPTTKLPCLIFCPFGLQIWGIFKFASLLPEGVTIKWSF